MSDDMSPTIVLVHGAFADGSSWTSVIERLQAKGMNVVAPANPLRGVTFDSAYLGGILEELTGPVLLVGHSYGGAVIANASAHADNVAGLVFVAAFAPAEGEVLGQVTATSKDAILGPALVQHSNHGEPELSVDPGKFHAVFCADLPAEQAAVLGATQRPIGAAAFSDVSGPVGWKHLPSWAVIGTADKAAGTDLTRSMAERAGAKITEVDSSHVIMISQPETVTDVIVQAAAAVREPAHVGA
jgi:pimeloyl-ACP methyl ester carboxylesterase